jgi:flagellar motor switch protein FliN/FliY
VHNDKLDKILDIPLEATVELGRASLQVMEILSLGQGSVVELTKNTGETLDLLANGKLVAKGETVIVKDKYSLRITDTVSPKERIGNLGSSVWK